MHVIDDIRSIVVLALNYVKYKRATISQSVYEDLIMSNRLVAAVESEPHPKSGQKHRSSGDFSLNSGQYTVKIDSGDNPDPKNIIFNIKKDVSGGDDSTIQHNVRDGSVISLKKNERTLYIGDPIGATTNFVVEFYD